uniref:Uncharacterized protein n=1 Tax=Romanomermis culicivorax TaxID=13658 RepID=A0A915HZL9_ROMCU
MIIDTRTFFPNVQTIASERKDLETVMMSDIYGNVEVKVKLPFTDMEYISFSTERASRCNRVIGNEKQFLQI